MFDASNRQAAKRDRSLLSLAHGDSAPGGSSADSGPRKSASSLLDLAGGQGGADPALRHRIARSRREAHPSPLLEALSNGGAGMPEQPAATASPPSDDKSSTAERLSGWMKRIFGRDQAIDAAAPVDSMPAAEGFVALQPRRAGADPFAPEPPAPVLAEPASAPAPERRAALERRQDAPAHAAPEAEAVETTTAGRQDYWQPLIDPFKVIGGIGKSRWLILATTIVGALVGVVIAMSTPKMYEAYTELVVDPRDLKLTERELTTTGLPSDATLALVENQARVLTSSLVLNQVVEKLNLSEDPEFNGQAGGAIGLSSAIGLIRSLLSGSDGEPDAGRKHALAVEYLGQNLTVERGSRTFVIVVAVKTRDPEKSALIANTMTEVFMQISGELQADTAGRATDELTARLDELQGGVEEAERKVAAFKAEHDIVDPQGRLITDDEIVKANDQLAVARARTIELNARAATARGVTAAAAASGALPEELASPVMTELRSQYASVKAEADRLASRLGPRHPTRLAAEAQVVGALDRIGGELRRISSSLQVDLQRAVEQEQSLASRLAQLKVRQGGIGNDLVTLRELEREAAAKRAVYEAFLLRARETAQQRGINATNVSVISPAYPPLDPTGPGRSTIAAAGMFLGLLFGVGLGAARGGWESLRENMAARPRRRRWTLGAGKPDRDPPPAPQPGNRNSKPEKAPEKGEGETMGLFSRLRRAPEPAPAVAAAPGYAQPTGNYPPAYAPPPVQTAPPAYPAAPAGAPVYGWQPAPQPVYGAAPAGQPGWPPAPQPSVHAAAGGGHPGWPPAPSVHAAAGGGHPGWPPAPSVHAAAGGGHPAWQPAPPAHAAAGGWPPAPQPAVHAALPGGQPSWAQPFAAPPPVHPAYAQAPAYAPPQMQPVAPAPVQAWPAAPAWQPAPQPAFPPQPVYVVAGYAQPAHEPGHAPRQAYRRPAAEALQPGADYSAMDEIRESLREFRDAVQGLAEQRRRYS